MSDKAKLSAICAGKHKMDQHAHSVGDIAPRLRNMQSKSKDRCLTRIRSSDFREFTTLRDQIRDIRKACPEMVLSEIAELFNVSISTVSRILNRGTPSGISTPLWSHEESRKAALLTQNEEEALITWITKCQDYGVCATSSQVRSKAQSLYKKRTGIEHEFSRQWFFSFHQRHREKLEIRRILAREQERQKVPVSVVQKYLAALLSAIEGVMSREQIINLDETGFSVRPNKGKWKKCVVVRDHQRAPSWQETRDGSHVSLLAAINLKGDSLKPFFITKAEPSWDSLLSPLRDDFEYYKTEKGYLTSKAMLKWTETVLTPYVREVRRKLGDETAKIVLIMDNFTGHSNAEVLKAFENLGHIVLVWLPPHSSHLFQPLDLFPFGELKRIYSSLSTPKTRPLINGKLFRILKAWHQTSFRANLLVGWARAGIDAFPVPPHVRLDFRTLTRQCITECVDDVGLATDDCGHDEPVSENRNSMQTSG